MVCDLVCTFPLRVGRAEEGAANLVHDSVDVNDRWCSACEDTKMGAALSAKNATDASDDNCHFEPFSCDCPVIGAADGVDFEFASCEGVGCLTAPGPGQL